MLDCDMASDTNRAGAGVLVAIGGAEDKLGHRTILNDFVQRAGGRRARIAVIATASSLGDEILGLYRRCSPTWARPRSCPCAPRPARRPTPPGRPRPWPGPRVHDRGNQLRLSMVVAGTRLGAALVEAHRRGVVVGGTSAGASALSAHMAAFGGPGEVPKQRLAPCRPGSGYCRRSHRPALQPAHRLGRLLPLVAESPASSASASTRTPPP